MIKHIDYLNLEDSTPRLRAGWYATTLDRKLNRTVWFGALAIFVLSAIVGVILFAITGNSKFMGLPASMFLTVPVLVYMSYWLFHLEDMPRATRLIIGISYLSLIVGLIIWFAGQPDDRVHWYTLIPLCLYFASCAFTSLGQLRLIRKPVPED